MHFQIWQHLGGCASRNQIGKYALWLIREHEEIVTYVLQVLIEANHTIVNSEKFGDGAPLFSWLNFSAGNLHVDLAASPVPDFYQRRRVPDDRCDGQVVVS